jgi:hypothetical protein
LLLQDHVKVKSHTKMKETEYQKHIFLPFSLP